MNITLCVDKRLVQRARRKAEAMGKTAGGSTVTSCMNARSLFDTNVVFYTDSRDAPAKRTRARARTSGFSAVRADSEGAVR